MREGGGKRREKEGGRGEGERERGPIWLPPGILCCGNAVGKSSPSISFSHSPLIMLYYFSKNKPQLMYLERFLTPVDTGFMTKRI